jgi:hypothetical protein
MLLNITLVIAFTQLPTELVKSNNKFFSIEKYKYDNFLTLKIQEDSKITSLNHIVTQTCKVVPACKEQTKKKCVTTWVVKDEKKCNKKKKCEHITKEVCSDIISKSECKGTKLECTNLNYESEIQKKIDEKIPGAKEVLPTKGGMK